jgi:hypothetical protein
MILFTRCPGNVPSVPPGQFNPIYVICESLTSRAFPMWALAVFNSVVFSLALR